MTLHLLLAVRPSHLRWALFDWCLYGPQVTSLAAKQASPRYITSIY